ncbi:MAG TPA: 50S ribosomal protein L15 [Acidimicrobiales bacterium]|jgi:large subunit ribosomal protein L15|nr:50S ribosomal protein L15 [Acidimicrobiales bacterium]
MKVHELRPPAGSTRPRRRVGRGIGGKGGKTAGRGTKGQGARDTIPMGFEGGQLPLMQRIPKLRGFKNPFRIDYTPVNVGALDAIEGDTADLAAIVAGGLARKGALVKILGGGELTRAIRVEAHAFSKTAEAAITASGGSITVVPLPFGHGRPPAQGNALTNR